MPGDAQISRKKDAVLRRLGTNIRAVRERVGVTQERLAEKADVAPRTIQRIEAGQLNILVTTLMRLAKALGCSSSDLLGG